jgi:hypothetical protein
MATEKTVFESCKYEMLVKYESGGAFKRSVDNCAHRKHTLAYDEIVVRAHQKAKRDFVRLIYDMYRRKEIPLLIRASVLYAAPMMSPITTVGIGVVIGVSRKPGKVQVLSDIFEGSSAAVFDISDKTMGIIDRKGRYRYIAIDATTTPAMYRETSSSLNALGIPRDLAAVIQKYVG